MTPEKERTNSFHGDLFLSLTPPKELREEQVGNFGLDMLPEHRFELGMNDYTKEQEQKVLQEDINCEKCKFTFRTNAHFKEHSKGPTCFASEHNAIPRLCREYPWECNLLDHKEYDEHKTAQQVKLNCKQKEKQGHC